MKQVLLEYNINKIEGVNMKRNIIAIMYDFDKTLCTKDMQEYTFIPNLGISPKEFWNETNILRKEAKIDSILAYMYLMKKKAEEKNIDLKRSYLNESGKKIELYKGVETWFDRINKYAKEKGIIIEHYIISSGLKEIIEGSIIGNKFKEIYASEFYYDEKGKIVWPKLAINYTNKTQFLIRINKGILDISDDYNLNKKMNEFKKRIPQQNMIYIGDGLTDIPCMKLTKEWGGTSIAVYSKKIDTAKLLLEDNRINFATEANYNENSELDKIVKNVIDKIAIANKLNNLNNQKLQ